MTQPLRVALVGANARGPGWARLSHAPALQHLPGFTLAAVCTTREESAAAAAQAFGAPRWYHDVDAMLRDPDVDIVSVVVKVPGHHDVVMAALRANKHVYCEWPLGVNRGEAEAMAAFARKQGVKAVVGLQARGDPVLRYLRDLVAEGYVGDVVSVSMSMLTGGVLERPASRLWDRDRRMGVSALTVRGIHTLDVLCHALGELVEVSTKVSTQVKQWRVVDTGEMVDVDAADSVAVNGVLEGGALLSAFIATVPFNGSGFRMEIFGREGTLRVTSAGAPQRDVNELSGSKGSAPLARLSVPDSYTEVPAAIPVGPPMNVGHLYLRLGRAIREGGAVDPDFDVAVRRHRLIDAIQQSSDEGRLVRVE